MPQITAKRAGALAVLVAVSLVAGCGGSGGATSLLDRAFSRSISSANVTIELTGRLNGQAVRLSGPVELRLSGPYQSNGSTKVPSFKWTLDVAGAGRTFSGGLISTGDDIYLTYGGTNYDFGRQRVAQANSQLAGQNGGGSLASFGANPRRWVRGAQVEGSASVGGVETTHVRAGLDVGTMLRDLQRAATAGAGLAPGAPAQLTDAQISAIDKAVHAPMFDVYVAKSDDSVRRLAAAFSFDVPSAQRSRLGGLRSGTLSFSVELAGTGQRYAISAPANPQPISDLAGLIGGGASSGANATPAPQQLQAYNDCIRRAGANGAAVAQCAQLLR